MDTAFVLVIMVGGTIFWIWAFGDAWIHEVGSKRTTWAVIIFFTHLLGALLYYLVRRPARWKEEDESHR